MDPLIRKFPVYFSALPELDKDSVRYRPAENLAFEIGENIIFNNRMIIDRGFAVYDHPIGHKGRLNILGFGYDFGEIFRGVEHGKVDMNASLMRIVLRVYEHVVSEAKKREMSLYVVDDVPEQDDPNRLYDALNTMDAKFTRLSVALPTGIPLQEDIERIVGFHRDVIRPILRLTKFEYFHSPEPLKRNPEPTESEET